MANPIRKISEKLHFGMEKVTPDSFIFAILLTFIVFVLALIVVRATPLQIVAAWHKGFWAYLLFSMQMTILLIFGYSVAITRPGVWVLDKLTGVAKTPAGAVAWVSFLASMLCLINWGLGLAGSIFLCLGTARRVKGVHWPLLVASAYIGCMATTAYSVSITEPLLLNQAGWGWAADVVPTVEKAIGQKLAPMGFEKTIYAPASIAAIIVSPLLCALLCFLMHPTPEKTRPITPEALKGLTAVADFESRITRGTEIADRLNWSRTLWVLVCLLVVAAAVLWFRGKSFLQLDLNMFNFLFILLCPDFSRKHSPVCRIGQKGHRSRLRDHSPVPVLRRDLRHHGLHGTADRDCQVVCEHFQPDDLPHGDHAFSGDHQYFHPLFRGDLDGARAAHHHGRRPAGGSLQPRRHGLYRGRGHYQRHPALLGAATPGSHEDGNAHDHGLLHRDNRCLVYCSGVHLYVLAHVK